MFQNNFQNLMHDDELCEIFNKAISSLAPEAVNIIWPEIKSSVEEQVMRVRIICYTIYSPTNIN